MNPNSKSQGVSVHGTGTVDENGVVTLLEIHSVSFVPQPCRNRITKLAVFSVGVLVVILAWCTMGMGVTPVTFLAIYATVVAFVAFLLMAALWALECKQK